MPLDGVKKQREVLLDKLDLLFVCLEKRETIRYEHLGRFQEVLLDIDKELPYIDKSFGGEENMRYFLYFERPSL